MKCRIFFSVCFIEWLTPVHDGPVTKMTKSPFLEHLLLTMGGYSFAIWNEGIMVKQNLKKNVNFTNKNYTFRCNFNHFFSESSRIDPFRRTRTIYLRCLVYWAAQYRYLKEAYALNKYDKFTHLHIFSIVYFSTESGTLEVWDITKRKSEPIQTQNIAGRAINVICPYRQESEIRRNKNQSNDGHYISIADNSGTLI